MALLPCNGDSKMDYEEWNRQQLDQAEAWLESNKAELSDVACPEQSVANKKGVELPLLEGDQKARLDQILDEICLEEAQDGSTWDFDDLSEQSMLEAKGQEDVKPLAHWVHGFDAEKYLAHEKKTKGLYNYAEGKAVELVAYSLRHRQMFKPEKKSVQIRRVLSRLDRRVNAAQARAALK
jgi:hypothetical protein